MMEVIVVRGGRGGYVGLMVHDCDDNDYIQMLGLFDLNWSEKSC
jgi:hypothetical protein